MKHSQVDEGEGTLDDSNPKEQAASHISPTSDPSANVNGLENLSPLDSIEANLSNGTDQRIALLSRHSEEQRYSLKVCCNHV